MNWTQISGQWEQVKGSIKQRWGKLTDDDLEQIEGQRDRLVGKLREYYGETKEALENKIDEFIDRL